MKTDLLISKMCRTCADKLRIQISELRDESSNAPSIEMSLDLCKPCMQVWEEYMPSTKRIMKYEYIRLEPNGSE
jgi:hypothetical protein